MVHSACWRAMGIDEDTPCSAQRDGVRCPHVEPGSRPLPATGGEVVQHVAGRRLSVKTPPISLQAP